jgi:hypothetical protein
MKRFLIFIILTAFVTAACAGPRKAGWAKPDFRQNEFEKDRQECVHRIGNHDLDPALFGERLERCLAEKNYKYLPSQTEVKSPEQTSSNLKEEESPLVTVIKIPLVIASLPIFATLFFTYAILGKDNSFFMW